MPVRRLLLCIVTLAGVMAPSAVGFSAPNEQTKADYAFGAYQRGYFLTALELALPRARDGDGAAQTLIAELYAQGFGVPRDFEKALFWYEQAAKNGDASGQFALAMLKLEGALVPQDKTGASKLLRLAAKAGHAQAQFNLGQLILVDGKRAENFTQALELFENSAKAGVADAAYAAAQIIAQGLHGLGARPQEAESYLRQAAQDDVVGAQVELGIYLANAHVATPDIDKITEAYKWLKKAAEAGNPVAQNRLSQIYAQGIGVPVNLIAAGKWHILARRAGVSDEFSERSFAKLSADQRGEAMAAANVLARQEKASALKAAKISPVVSGGSGSILDLPLQGLSAPGAPILPQ